MLDNGSRDGTAAAAAQAARGVQACRVTVGVNRANYSLGGSHKAAFAHAAARGYSHVVVLHGDDQGSIAEVLPLLAAGGHRRHDACLGSRFMRGSRLLGYSTFRIFGNHVFNALFSVVTLRRISDLGSGLNVFSRRVFTDPAVVRHADDLRFNNFLLLGLIDRRISIRFFPISWREDDQVSNVKIVSQSLRTLNILVQYVFARGAFRTQDHRRVRHETYGFEVIGGG